MSAADTKAQTAGNIAAPAAADSGIETADLAHILELAALRGRADDLRAVASHRGITLPDMGRAVISGDDLTLCVRPNRWLILRTSSTAGMAGKVAAADTAADWQRACEGVAAAVDLSSYFASFRLNNPATLARLAGGCRVDLDPRAFPEGHAAATIIPQVAVILVRMPGESKITRPNLLLLTPATTARHLREWLGESLR